MSARKKQRARPSDSHTRPAPTVPPHIADEPTAEQLSVASEKASAIRKILADVDVEIGLNVAISVLFTYMQAGNVSAHDIYEALHGLEGDWMVRRAPISIN